MHTITTELTANREGLVPHLSDQFASKTTFLMELIQNARRSGSPDVRIDFDPEASTLTVSDSGRGIDLLSDLFSLGSSGFRADAELAGERPFGLGFAACLFAAERISIESRRFAVDFETASLLRFEPVDAGASDTGDDDFYPGTRIRLWLTPERLGDLASPRCGMRETPLEGLRGRLEDLVAGFSIPVFFGDEELPRPHALTDEFVGDTVKIKASELKPGSAGDDRFHFYLQGLPVAVGERSSGSVGNVIVHLDNSFRARVPDRNVLVDGEDERAISLALAERDRVRFEFLKAQKAAMSPEDFSLSYWNAAKRFAPNLLRDCPLPPSAYFLPSGPRRFEPEARGFARLIRERSSDFRVRGDCCLPASQLAMVATVEDDCIDIDDIHPAAVYLVARARGIAIIAEDLPEGHWANSAPDMDPESPTVEPVGGFASVRLDGHYVCDRTIVFCDHFLIDPNDGSGVVRVDDCPVIDPQDQSRMLWPQGATARCFDTEHACLQFDDYIDGSDTFRVDWLESDAVALQQAINAASGDVRKTLESIISQSASSLSDLMKGREFRLFVDERGSIRVADAA